MPKCVPCLGTAIKQAVLERNKALFAPLSAIADCDDSFGFDLCGGRVAKDGRRAKGKRPLSEYQLFMKSCLTSKPIKGKGFGAAAPYLKECAADWRRQRDAQGS